MANKAISELPQALNVNNQDLFVLEQSGIAKKLTAETFITEQGIIDALAEALDGHGGISSVTLSSVSGRIRTYLITFTDETTTTFQVYDGTSIERISKTSSSGLQDTYTIFMSDGTTTFFTVTNGADGDVSEAMLNDALKDKAPAITETTESSAIATFSDGADNMVMHNIVAKINPVQDLTYGDPYPAGGGANKLDPATVTVYSSSVYGFTATWNANDGSLNINGTYTGSGSSAVFRALKVPSAVRSLNVKGFSSSSNFSLLKWQNGADQIVTELTGMVQNSSYNITIYPIVYEGSTAPASWTPYENICPITGWTGANVTRTGKNLLDSSSFVQGSIDPNTGAEYDSNTRLRSPFIKLPAGQYTISSVNGFDSVFDVYDENQQFIRSESFTSWQSTPHTYSISGTRYVRVLFRKTDNSVITPSELTGEQLELGSTVTAYEPYITPSTVSLSWQTEAGTVYGGTIDVATGLLTVTKASVTVGDLTVYSAFQAGTYSCIKRYRLPNNANSVPYNTTHGAISDMGIEANAYFGSVHINEPNSANVDFAINTDGSLLAIYDPDTAITESDFNTKYTGMQIVYPLATPQTYQLTPQQLMTLLGTNNVWADTGNVSVTYPADTKLYIQNLTQPSEDDLVANQAITSGKYFMIGNSLYLALANIASGAQITIGTNAQRVSLADALNTINS